MRKMLKIVAVVFAAGLLPAIASAQAKPRITAPANRSTSEVGKDIKITATGSNLEIMYAGLTGEPNPASSSEPFFEKGVKNGGNVSFKPANAADWANKWLKIIAHDKVKGSWSEPVYVRIMPPKPRITSPSNKSKYVLGRDISVSVSDTRVTEIYYVGLTGNPDPTKPSLRGEPYFMSAKAHFIGGDQNSFRYTFRPPSTPAWQNKWVKIVAHNGTADLWSDPVYVQITPPQIVADKVTGRGIVVNAKMDVPKEGGVVVKDQNNSKSCVIYLPKDVATRFYVELTKPTAKDYATDWIIEGLGFIPVAGDFIGVVGTLTETVKKVEVGKFAKAHGEMSSCSDCFLRVNSVVNLATKAAPGVAFLLGDAVRTYQCEKKPQLSPGDGQFFKMSELKDKELSDYFFYGYRVKR